MGVSKEELTTLIADLVAIDSTNPDLVTGGAGEAEIARFVAGWLERAGLERKSMSLVRAERMSSRLPVVAVATAARR
jgi:acetylornithine deacetylase